MSRKQTTGPRARKPRTPSDHPSFVIPSGKHRELKGKYWGRVFVTARIRGKAIKIRVEFIDGKAHEWHHHPDHDEFVTVISGRLRQYVGNKEYVLKVGETASIRKGQWHKAIPLNPGTVVMVELFGEKPRYIAVEAKGEAAKLEQAIKDARRMKTLHRRPR